MSQNNARSCENMYPGNLSCELYDFVVKLYIEKNKVGRDLACRQTRKKIFKASN